MSNKFSPCPVNGKHKWTRIFTADCQFDWQFQMGCACGVLKDSKIYGVPPTPEAAKEAISTAAPPAATLSLDSPADVYRIVQTLFDCNLDWKAAVQALHPQLGDGEAFALGQSWSEDLRVEAAIRSRVRDLMSQERRAALLLHHAEQMAVNDALSGAVRSTALNVLKAAHIVEKTDHTEHTRIQISNLPSLLEGIGVSPAQEDTAKVN